MPAPSARIKPYRLTFPATGTDGTYYIIARVDSSDEVDESDENNNWGQPGDRGLLWGHDDVAISTALPDQPDLTGYWLQADSASAEFGQTLKLSHFQIDNLGGAASGDFDVKFSLSTDNSGDVGDTDLTITGTGSTTLSLSSLASGARSPDQTVTLDLPGRADATATTTSLPASTGTTRSPNRTRVTIGDNRAIEA